MSINVTVHGNPISIKKGKMVTCDSESEFDRRRLIRLQQVRQQSKEIAADVRNRVRKEKAKQLSKAGQKEEETFERWKARKLLALQQQYEDCLKEVGSAQLKATLEPDADEVLNELTAKHQAESDVRGKIATEKQRSEDEQIRMEQLLPVELKKLTRKIEDTRAAMVSKINQGNFSGSSSKKKKKKKKKIATDVTITNNIVNESDSSEMFISDVENITANITKKKTSPKKKKKRQLNIDLRSPDFTAKQNSTVTTNSSRKLDSPPSIRSVSPRHLNRSILSANSTPPLSPKRLKHKDSEQGFKRSTSIADRIKQRKLPELAKEEEDFSVIYNIKNPEKSTSTYKPKLQIESYKICDIQGEPEQRKPKTSLPFVSKTTVRPDSHPILSGETQQSKVKYYDHFNRFNKEYSAQPVVQKIDKNSIEVEPQSERSNSPNDMLKTMQARDKVAHNRGVRAMEKEKIHKDYKQLMEELPLLQKQERLASMRTHNPSFHMPEDRLEELERRRQNKIENIFEKYYHKSKSLETPLITIRPIQKTPPADELKLPFRALDVTESPRQLNVAEWKTDYQQDLETGPQVQEEHLQTKQRALEDLLQRVNKQRELLLQEVSTLPATSNLQKILQDEEMLKIIDTQDTQESSSKQSLKTKKTVSTGTSPLLVKTPSSNKFLSEKENNKRGRLNTSSSDNSTETIKKKKNRKAKNKRHKKLIKDEGTQTSPVTTIAKTNLTNVADSKRQSQTICDDEHPGKLCEIIIKTGNHANVKVCSNDEQPVNQKVTLKVNKKPMKRSSRSPSNGNDLSTTTNYMSPPEQKNIKTSTVPKQRQQYKDLLHHKPKQTNVDRTNRSRKKSPNAIPDKKEITPALLIYIKKLLNMSRQSIDDLTISSISDVSTPGTTIVNTSENNCALAQLQNVMQHYNLNFDDIQRHLATSNSSKSSNECSTTETQTNKGTEKIAYIKNISSDETPEQPEERKYSLRNEEILLTKIATSKSVQTQRSPPEQSSPARSIRSPRNHVEVAQIVTETFDLKPKDMKEIPIANILSTYKDLTETCCHRITKLTEMIDNVRIEKERLLSPDASDKYEISLTSYLDLPKISNDSTRADSYENKSGRHSNTSSSSSMSQDTCDRYLLAIDQNPSRQTSPTQNRISNVNDTDELPVSDRPKTVKHNQENFVPMLQGIPKYTDTSDNQAMNYLNSPVKQFLQSTKTKPPPALLRNANKYNLNIDMTPHELSTIVELDTVVSSKNVSEIALGRPRTPEEKIPSRVEIDPEKSKIDDGSGFVTLTPEQFKTSPEEQKDSSYSCECSTVYLPKNSEHATRKSSLRKSSQSTSPTEKRSLSSAQLSGVQPINYDTSTSPPEDFENALRSMGICWAVSTMKKTHEALALSSSSSSADASFMTKRVCFQDSSNSNSNSDVSLRQELNDLSEIRDPTIQNRDASHQRTSTPVQQSKSTDSKREFFSGDSDLSSVRLQNEELFLTVPNLSLDTNKSLSKSKE